jgi:hypothetical protein
VPILSLAPGITFCEVDGSRIFLDLERDRYFSLGALSNAAFDTLLRGRPPSEAEQQRLERLAEAGVLGRQPFGEAPRPCRPVSIDRAPLDEDIEQHIPALRIARSAIAFRVTKAAYRRHGLRHAWTHLGRMKELRLSALRPGTVRQLEELALRFDAVGRVVGALNHCVPFSVTIARACIASELEASLVLGVKLRPFQAHAWAMSGRTLLSDRLSTVAQFTPIAIL